MLTQFDRLRWPDNSDGRLLVALGYAHEGVPAITVKRDGCSCSVRYRYNLAERSELLPAGADISPSIQVRRTPMIRNGAVVATDRVAHMALALLAGHHSDRNQGDKNGLHATKTGHLQ